MSRLPQLLCGVLLAMLASAALCAPVGRFQVVSGDVQIITDGKSRAAARGEPVNERDTIVTGANGLGHIRMIDEGIVVALEPWLKAIK